MYKYKLSLEAEEDILRIFEYGLTRFGIVQAIRYYEMLFDCFSKIATNPFLFPEVHSYKNVERYCVCGVDTIYYNIKTDEIEIITIIGRQNF